MGFGDCSLEGNLQKKEKMNPKQTYSQLRMMGKTAQLKLEVGTVDDEKIFLTDVIIMGFPSHRLKAQLYVKTNWF